MIEEVEFLGCFEDLLGRGAGVLKVVHALKHPERVRVDEILDRPGCSIAIALEACARDRTIRAWPSRIKRVGTQNA